MNNPSGQNGGSAGAAGQHEMGGAGGSGTTYGVGGHIDHSLKAETREIMRVMGGEQPHESEWDFLFWKSDQGGTSGSCRSTMADKMEAAHNVARWIAAGGHQQKVDRTP